MGEIVTPQDKSKLFSVMKTRKIASLLKIYGPQIIPKRQRAFPTKAFLLIQAAHLFKQAEEPAAPRGCVQGAGHAFLPVVSALWGPEEVQYSVNAHQTFCLCASLHSGSRERQLGRIPSSCPPTSK